MTILDKDDSVLNDNKNKKRKRKKKVTKIKKVEAVKPVKQVKPTKNVKKKHTMFYKLVSFILIVTTLIMLGLFIYNEILSLFVMIPISLIILFIIFGISFLLNKTKLRTWVKSFFSLIAIIIIIGDLLMIFYGTDTLKFLSDITDTGYRVETYGIYVLNDSSYKTLNDLNNKTIYYLDHDKNSNNGIRGAIDKVRKKIKIDVDYEDTVDKLIKALVNHDADAILMEVSYEDLIKDEYSDTYNKLKLIDEIDIVDNIKTIKSDVDITKDPFIVYISGVDTNGSVQAKARSDVNLLLAVNPENKRILMINTPRDYYVTLHSKKRKDKLTHAGIYGIEESVHTLEDLYDTSIDYYVRINFTSFIKIVDALGGVKVDVPIKFCEQNSLRSFESKDLICLNKGYQTLNGEQALALSRHRKTLGTGDIARGENQMLVLEAIINKALSPSILTKYNSLIKSLEGRVSTNMTSNEMYRFAKKQKNLSNDWVYESINATGTNSSGICFSSNSKAYVMEPDENLVNTIKEKLNDMYEKTV